MKDARSSIKRYASGRRWRWLVYQLWWSLPLAVSAFVIARWMSWPLSQAWTCAAVVGFMSLVGFCFARHRSFPTLSRVSQHLDRRFDALQDSTHLLFANNDELSRVARLQQQRVATLVNDLEAAGALSHGVANLVPMTAALGVCAVLLNLGWWLPGSVSLDTERQTLSVEPAIISAQVDERPADYTGLAAVSHSSLSFDAREFSMLRWTLRVEGRADSVSIQSQDGERIALYSGADGYWQSEWVPAFAANYQVLLDNEAEELESSIEHRIIVVPDRPPALRILAPVDRIRTLNESEPRALTAKLSLSDDYGVKALSVVATTAEGDGEQVTFESREQDLTRLVSGDGEVTTTLELDSLGAAPGREVYLAFEAEDGRPETPNKTVSTSLIVRWDVESGSPDIVLDNQIVVVEPEYFRSQRQIIIDSEALLDEQGSITADTFSARAQSLAFDERALRFRYGEFMGEEASGEPVAGARQLGTQGHYVGDGHNHDEEEFALEARREFGDVMAAISPYAHFHDQEEQATIFDSETRALLGQALSAMWRAEGFLLQHDPESSLPHQYRALALIKRVQDRSRVVVNKVGVSITPIDFSRTLTGELDEIPARRELDNGLPLETGESEVPVDAVVALTSSSGFRPDDVERVRRWARARAAEASSAGDVDAERDFRDLLAALATWQKTAECPDCRQTVQAVWQRQGLVPTAPPARQRQSTIWFDGSATP
ncbi:MAG: hypothetical protein AAF578_15500 [Pseudomonadota bacterium]